MRRLADAAYSRVDLVEKRGEFAVRGGIVDVFPPTEEHPLRVEFWGDDVEEIRTFAVADQRTLEKVERLWAPPCRELLLTDEVRRRAAELGEAHPQLAELTDKIAAGIAVEGMESLAPVLVDEMELLVDLMPDDTHVLVLDPERVRSRAHDLVATSEEFLGASLGRRGRRGHGADRPRRRVVPRRSPTSATTPCEQGQPGGRSARSASTTRLAGRRRRPSSAPSAPTRSTAYRGDVERARRRHPRLARPTAAASSSSHPGHGPAQRMVEVLGEHDVAGPAGRATGADVDARAARRHGHLRRPRRTASSTEAVGSSLLTGEDLSGQKAATRDMRRMPARRKKPDRPARAQGRRLRRARAARRRPLRGDEAARGRRARSASTSSSSTAPSKRGGPPDRLYVPADALDQVTRYVGGEQPRLDRLGGADWAKRKGRARKAVREIAAELIKLYAARQATQGHAFGPDTPWQRELEDAFPFHETPDQLTTVDEVKADMRRTVPMDRLVCGDVGYGKTEIAVRAAFKAVQDGKQVAVLVPTTLLVHPAPLDVRRADERLPGDHPRR